MHVPINPTCIIVMVQSHLGIIAWTIEWTISCIVITVVGPIKGVNIPAYYSTTNFSMISLCNRNSWVNRRCGWTITPVWRDLFSSKVDPIILLQSCIFVLSIEFCFGTDTESIWRKLFPVLVADRILDFTLSYCSHDMCVSWFFVWGHPLILWSWGSFQCNILYTNGHSVCVRP